MPVSQTFRDAIYLSSYYYPVWHLGRIRLHLLPFMRNRNITATFGVFCDTAFGLVECRKPADSQQCYLCYARQLLDDDGIERPPTMTVGKELAVDPFFGRCAG